MTDKTEIPSREKHNRFIRLVWKLCIATALICFVFMGGTVLVMKILGHNTKTIVEVQLIIVYIILPGYAIGYVAPTLATSLIKMSLGLEMSRRGLEIGEQTAGILDNLKRDIQPMLDDAKEVFADAKPTVESVKEMIESFKMNDWTRAREALHRIEDELNGGGKLDRLVTALEKIAARTDQKADDALEDLLKEAWEENSKESDVDTTKGV